MTIRRQVLKQTIAWLVLTILYWGGFTLLKADRVVPEARFILYAACASGLLLTGRKARDWLSPTAWLAYAMYSVSFALIFYGVNEALDILYGAGRAKSDVASHIGGLELWWILCPGVFSVAVASAAASFSVSR
jgi:hypothetical protein